MSVGLIKVPCRYLYYSPATPPHTHLSGCSTAQSDYLEYLLFIMRSELCGPLSVLSELQLGRHELVLHLGKLGLVLLTLLKQRY